jgi:hypothetical protein
MKKRIYHTDAEEAKRADKRVELKRTAFIEGWYTALLALPG